MNLIAIYGPTLPTKAAKGLQLLMLSLMLQAAFMESFPWRLQLEMVVLG